MATLPIRLVSDTASPRLLRQARSLNADNRRRILLAMGALLRDATIRNIGNSGPDRPNAWSNLTPEYAKRIGRTHATLIMTAAERIKEGKAASLPHLRDMISVTGATGEKATVTADVTYAAKHQLRGPRRPYFPVKANNQPTEKMGRSFMSVLRRMVGKDNAKP